MKSERRTVRATAAHARLAGRLAQIKRDMAEMEAEKESINKKLLKAVGDADVLEGEDFAFSKRVATSTSWKSVAIEAGASGELIAKYTSTGATFLVPSGELFSG